MDDLTHKQAIFARLDALNREDEDVEDDGYQASVRALDTFVRRCEDAGLQDVNSQGFRHKAFAAQRHARLAKPNLLISRHIAGAPSIADCERLRALKQAEKERAQAREMVGEDANLLKYSPAHLQTDTDGQVRKKVSNGQLDHNSISMGTTMGKATGKRKRCNATNIAQAKKQIFANSIMLFVPNNTIAPARRQRIRKAEEHGATHTLAFSTATTHIIVDKDLGMKDVLKDLKIEVLPNHVITVNESYTADCIAWKRMLDHTQGRYQVPGLLGDSKHATLKKATSDPSDASLQLKPAKGADVTYEPQTPSRTDGSNTSPWSMGGCSSSKASRRAGDELDVPVVANDPLQQAIEKARAAPHLPAALFSEADSRPVSFCSENASESEYESPKQPRLDVKKQGYTKGKDWQSNFECMKDHKDEDRDNPNAKTIAILEEMENYYYSVRDEWRTRAYRKAIAALRKQACRTVTKEDAGSIPNIGSRLAAKIEEIVVTNSLQRLEYSKCEPTDQAISIFLGIYGVGYRQASLWVQEGHRTLEDLRNNPGVKLTTNQTTGIEHYEDFKLRIPRSETRQLADIVLKAAHNIDPALELTIGGSYRRGAKDSGDIDLVITKQDTGAEYLRQVTLDKLVPFLQKIGFLIASLAVTSKDDGSKWHGACQLPLSPTISIAHPNDPATNTNPWRRIDLLLVPWDDLGAAMVYFTGNDIFNRSMRLLARRKGMRLNQRGLYKDVMRKGAERLSEGTKISGWDEREVFRILGVPWREAEERNV